MPCTSMSSAANLISIICLAAWLVSAAAIDTWMQPNWRYPPAQPQEWFKPTMPEQHVYLDKFTQQLVDPGRDLLTILLPILPSTFELGYVLNQMRTFSRFADMDSIREYLIITPQKHKPEMEAFVHRQLPQQVPGIEGGKFRVVTDGDCIPEANPDFEWYRDPAEYWWNGWLTQQLVKLACAALVRTPFYMVMDADIFAARPFSAPDLFDTSPCTPSSAVCDLDKHQQLRAKNDCHRIYGDERDQNLEWWAHTALNLQLDVRLDWDCTPGVTPQIMATHVSLQLARWLESRFQTCCWHGLLLDIGDRHNWRRGDAGLPWSAPWTEYAVYFLFAHHTGLHDAFHVDVRNANDQILQDTAVWTPSDLAGWEPCRDTFSLGRGYMSLVQSRLEQPPEDIWQRIQACWHEAAMTVSQDGSQDMEAREQDEDESREQTGGRLESGNAATHEHIVEEEEEAALLLMHSKPHRHTLDNGSHEAPSKHL